MLEQSLLNQLESIVGTDNLFTDITNLDIFSSDALSPNRAYSLQELLTTLPSAVICPSSAAQISKIVKLCNKHKIPLTAVGGGTGVMGGITPSRGSLIISLIYMNDITNFDPVSQSVTAQAGLLLGELSKYLNSKNYILGHDPYSLNIATVGGAISTNGVGYTASKYGTMGEQVISLEVVLPSGDILPISYAPTSSVGPDVSKLFIGSEGTLGIITSATIKIFPKPAMVQFLTIGFLDFEIGYKFLLRIWNCGSKPSLIDLTEENTTTTMHLMFDGEPEIVISSIHWVKNQLDGINQYLVNLDWTVSYWDKRHSTADSYALTALRQQRSVKWARNSNNLFEYLHVSLPPSKVLSYKEQSQSIVKDYDLSVTEYAIWGKPDFFSMMLVPKEAAPESASQRLFEASNRLLTLSCEMGGSIEYCHGIGIKLKHLLNLELGSSYQLLKTIKTTLDTNNIMNPNKFI